MGTYRKGILGSFTGKVGTVVGSSWRGIDYMRSLPRRSSKEPTEPQAIQRAKFGLVAGFLAPIRGLLDIGFKTAAVNQTGSNAAAKEMFEFGITGAYPNFTVDYPNVKISKGSLTGAFNASVTPGTDQVTVTWEDNTGSGNAKATDKAIILVYNEEQSQYIYTTDGPERSAATYVYNMPDDFAGDTVEVWLGFISADGKLVADSVHAGDAVIE